MTRAEHPWESCDGSCDCHNGMCADCGCTNERIPNVAPAAVIREIEAGPRSRSWADDMQDWARSLPADDR